jgi:GT2 family glycosyltransferase
MDARLQLLRKNQTDLEQRLARVENSIVFRTLRGIGGWASVTRGKFGQALLHSPLHGLYTRIAGGAPDPYTAWIEEAEAALAPHSGAAAWSCRPHITVVIPSCKPNPQWLRQAVESVRNQSWQDWELCVCIDGPDDQAIQLVNELAANEPRIRVTSLPVQSGISAALNGAGKLAAGEYVAFLDHDDVLSPFALHYIVEALQDPPADVLYSDEDSLGAGGRRVRPNFKPAWSPELLSSCMYAGHLLVVRRELLDNAGWFRSEFDGAQDYDLALRLADAGAVFRHVPRVLYHWRIHEGSTAASAAAKPWAREAGRRALADALSRRGEQHSGIEDGPVAHTYRIRRTPIPSRDHEGAVKPLSIVIPSRNPDLIERCLRSLEQTLGATECEYVVVHHAGTAADARMTGVLARSGCTVEVYRGRFNFAAMNNAGAQRARHENLLFLNDDIVATEKGWAEALLAQIARPGIGAAGALLLYPSGAIQHAGIVTGIGQGSGHIGRGAFASDLWRWLRLTRDVSAVTGACLAIRRDLFLAIGGFDPGFPVNYNDVDLCLRLREQGHRVVLEAQAVLRHDECRTRAGGTTLEERERFYTRWGEWLARPDPFYSPWLDPADEAIRLKSV